MTSNTLRVDELVLGYDAREYWQSFDQTWPQSRKQGFLYKLDVLKPLSADTGVWPTIFASESREEPPGKFGYQHCWSFLADVTVAVTREFQVKPLRAWRLIAITLLHGGDKLGDVAWTAQVPEADPPKPQAVWLRLGYDVCDFYMLSGLMNCGFLPETEDVVALRAKWGPRLNQFHLFDRLDDAIEFKQFSDVRMKDDHAPFYVFGLWMIQEA